MNETLTRYDLGEIRRLHDEAHYRQVTPDYVAKQLARIGLSKDVSRFEVAERVRELERDIDRELIGEVEDK